VLEALRRWIPGAGASFQSVREVERLLEAQPGRRVEYDGAEIWREREFLLFTPDRENTSEETIRLEFGDAVRIGEAILEAERLDTVPEVLDEGRDAALVDASMLEMPLTVRRWRAGDRFSPLGMGHTKKISDFLTDERVSPHGKAETNVVESAGRIVWVVGYRISDDFRVRENTTRVARLRFHRAENTSGEAE
jgi:tRNA(Ile)-lysidine synthase